MQIKPPFSPGSLLACAVIGLLSIASPITLAAEEAVEDVSKTLARRQRRADHAREFVSWLSLSRNQARRILSLVENAADLHIQAYEIEAELLPETHDAFAEFAREDSLNQGFSREVEARTARVNHQAKVARQEISGQLAALEHEAAALLTPDQLELSETVNPSFWRGLGMGKTGNPARRAAIGIAAKRWRDANKGRLDRARDELREQNRKIHPHMGRLGQNLLHPLAAETICTAAGFQPSSKMREAASLYAHGSPQYPINQLLDRKNQVQGLRTEISNWNLINGLNLNEQQIGRIVGLYDSVRGELSGNRGRANRASGRRKEVLFALERWVEQTLNPGQRQVMAEFKACLIPPKNLKDPVRAGQANDNTRMTKWLTRARKASRDKRARMVENFLETQQEHLGEMSDRQWNQRADLLMQTIEQAVELSDVDFELEKEVLAESIQPVDSRDVLKREIAELSLQRGAPGTIARLMLKPQFIDQLRIRGRQLAQGVVPAVADMARGPQAANCEKSCAIDSKRGKKTRRK